MRAHLLFIVLVACDAQTNYEPGLQAGAPWPVIGHDDGVTSRGDVVATRTGHVRWKHDTGAFIGTASPVIAADGTIYIGNGAGTFSAVHPDGSLAWTVQMGAVQGAAAIATDGSIYVASNDTRVHTLSPSGADTTTNACSDSISSSVLLDEQGIAYFTAARRSCRASRGGSIDCDAFTEAMPQGSSNTSFALANHRLYVTEYDGAIDTFTTAPADPARAVATAQGLLGAVTADGTTYVIANDRIEAHDANAQFSWACDVPPSITKLWLRIAVARADLVMIAVDTGVIATGPNGIAWTVDVGAHVSGGISVDAGGAVFFGADDGNLYAFDVDGSPLFSVPTTAPFVRLPRLPPMAPSCSAPTMATSTPWAHEQTRC